MPRQAGLASLPGAKNDQHALSLTSCYKHQAARMPAAWRGKYYPPAMEIYRIIYTSTAVRAPGPAEFERLLMQARIYNYSLGISGLLLRAETQYLQLLEGPAAAVAGLYERIAHDPRHYGVKTLEHAAVPRLLLPHASLAFADTGPANLARLVAALAPPHRQSPPLARDGQRNTAAVLLNFIEVHCSHLLALPGPDPASRLPRPQPT